MIFLEQFLESQIVANAFAMFAAGYETVFHSNEFLFVRISIKEIYLRQNT